MSQVLRVGCNLIRASLKSTHLFTILSVLQSLILLESEICSQKKKKDNSSYTKTRLASFTHILLFQRDLP